MKDTAYLPWPDVREAYANSMHDIEEGSLKWAN